MYSRVIFSKQETHIDAIIEKQPWYSHIDCFIDDLRGLDMHIQFLIRLPTYNACIGTNEFVFPVLLIPFVNETFIK